MRVEPVDIVTPVGPTTGVKLTTPRPLVVPILRAGLGMLDGMMRLLPTAEVGFLGMIRNEETLEASTYAERLPEDLSGRQCYVLDPMLATGGTLAAAIRFLTDRGADHITAICLLPPGLRPRRASDRRMERGETHEGPRTDPGDRRHRGPATRRLERPGVHRARLGDAASLRLAAVGRRAPRQDPLPDLWCPSSTSKEQVAIRCRRTSQEGLSHRHMLLAPASGSRPAALPTVQIRR